MDAQSFYKSLSAIVRTSARSCLDSLESEASRIALPPSPTLPATKRRRSHAPKPTVSTTANTAENSAPGKHLLPTRTSDEAAAVIAMCLDGVTLENDAVPPSVFDCPAGTQPSLSVRKYVERIANKSHATPEAMLVAVVLLDRILETGLPPSKWSVYRMYATCAVLAIKLQDDRYYTNKFYARVVGVSLEELNEMERTVLNKLSFDLYVSQADWAEYAAPAEQMILALQSNDHVASASVNGVPTEVIAAADGARIVADAIAQSPVAPLKVSATPKAPAVSAKWRRPTRSASGPLKIAC